MLNSLWIFVGGGLGSVARLWISGLVVERAGGYSPWGTLVVNVTGSFAIGLFAAMTGPGGRFMAPLAIRHFFITGLCGGYTTFSTFSLQTLNLAEHGEWFRAGANAVLSLVLCLAAVWLGQAAAGFLIPGKES